MAQTSVTILKMIFFKNTKKFQNTQQIKHLLIVIDHVLNSGCLLYEIGNTHSLRLSVLPVRSVLIRVSKPFKLSNI